MSMAHSEHTWLLRLETHVKYCCDTYVRTTDHVLTVSDWQLFVTDHVSS